MFSYVETKFSDLIQRITSLAADDIIYIPINQSNEIQRQDTRV